MGFNPEEWSRHLCDYGSMINRMASWDEPAKAHLLDRFSDDLEQSLRRIQSFEHALALQDKGEIPDLGAALPVRAVTLRAATGAEFVVAAQGEMYVHPGWNASGDSFENREFSPDADFTVYAGETKGSDGLVEAVEELGNAVGFGDPFDITDESGSRFRRWRAKASSSVQTESTRSVAYALELAALGIRQAEVSAMLADSAETLCRCIGDQEVGIARMESVLVLKYPIDGRSAIIIRQLSVAEILVFQRFPEIESKPTKVLDALATALSSDPNDLTLERLMGDTPEDPGEST